MRRIQESGAAVILALSVVSVALAQGQAPSRADGLNSLVGMGLGPQTPITILMSPAVQKELKFTEAQKTKTYDLALAAGQKQRDLFQAAAFGGGGNPQAFMMARNGLRQQNDEAVSRILEPKQQERFDQIVLQAEGPLAVARPEIASKLRINETQSQYINRIMFQMQLSQREMYIMARRQAVNLSQLDPSRFTQVRQAMLKVRDGAVQQIGKVLDRKQKANFNKMLGDPFDLAKLDAEPSAEPDAAAKSKSKATDATTTSKDETSGAKDAPPAEKASPKATGKTARKKTRKNGR